MERQTLIEQYGTLAEAARVLGIPRTTLSSRVNSQKISREVEILLPPTEYEPIVVKVFWDIEEGIEFLNWKRA